MSKGDTNACGSFVHVMVYASVRGLACGGNALLHPSPLPLYMRIRPLTHQKRVVYICYITWPIRSQEKLLLSTGILYAELLNTVHISACCHPFPLSPPPLPLFVIDPRVSLHNLMRRAWQVRLGCNDGWRKGCANYFILVGADYPAEKRSSPDGGSSAGGSIPAYNRAFSASVSRSSSGPPFEVLPLPPPPRAPRPRGLLSDGDSGDADGATTARWVLRPHAVAGGKGSLAQAVRALVDETKKSRAKSRTQLLPGAEHSFFYRFGLSFVSVSPFEFAMNLEKGGREEDVFWVGRNLCYFFGAADVSLHC